MSEKKLCPRGFDCVQEKCAWWVKARSITPEEKTMEMKQLEKIFNQGKTIKEALQKLASLVIPGHCVVHDWGKR